MNNSVYTRSTNNLKASILIDKSNDTFLGRFKSIDFILIGGIDHGPDIKDLINSNFNFDLIGSLNGEFSLIIIESKCVKIITDRYNSIPIYYNLVGDNLFISDKLNSLFHETDGRKLNEEVFFEFLYFQKIHGSGTVLKNVYKSSSASILKIDGNDISNKKYWIPTFDRTNKNTLNKNSEILAEHLYNSVQIKANNISKKQNLGIFLSGGLDTRCVLAACRNSEIQALTLGFSENGEYKTARLLTEGNKKIDHKFIKLDKDHFSNNFHQIIDFSSCSYVFDHSLFYGINYKSKYRNRFLNGYGLDFMFQGMYIPRLHFKILGKPTYVSKIRDNNPDNALDYIENISYKYKNVNPFDYVRKDKVKHLKDFIYSGIKDVEKNYKDSNVSSLTDFYDLMIINDISSHYSYSNVISMKRIGEIRTIAFENSLFDFFLKTPTKHRLNARILKHALKYMNLEFANIKSANHGMKITLNEYEMTAVAILRKLSRIFLNSKNQAHPTAEQRTWPDRYEHVIKNEFFKSKALELIKSDHIDHAMPYLNRDKLNNYILDSLEGKNTSFGDTLTRLISIDQFLKSKS